MKDKLNVTQPEFIFIGGSYRTGTDLVRNILNSAEDVAICGETNFLGSPRAFAALLWDILPHSHNGSVENGSFFGLEPFDPGAWYILTQVADIATDAGAKEIVDYIYNHKLGRAFWERWLPTHVCREEFLGRLLETDRTDKALFELLMALYANGKAIRGEKTPAHLYHVPTLFEWFPKAKFIHMFRDPRAIFISQKKKNFEQRRVKPHHHFFRQSTSTYEIYLSLNVTIHWLRVVRLHYRYQQLYPANYYLLKFEDLITDPETHVRKLCNFLEIDFDEKMLRRKVVNSSFGSHNPIQGFNISAIHRWREHLHPITNKWFVLFCKKELLEFGYQP